MLGVEAPAVGLNTSRPEVCLLCNTGASEAGRKENISVSTLSVPTCMSSAVLRRAMALN